MRFSQQEYRSGLPQSLPGDCLAGGFFTTEPLGEPTLYVRESPLEECRKADGSPRSSTSTLTADASRGKEVQFQARK